MQVNGYTAEKMKEIADAAIDSVAVVGDNLVITHKDGSTTNAGNVRGLQGFPGISDMSLYDPVGVPKPLLIPTVPNGHGVCNATDEYDGATYPILADAYGTGQACVNGAAAVGKFKLPDLRGKTIYGLHTGIAAFDALLKTGGSKDAVVVQHDHPASSDQPEHNHFGATNWAGSHTHSVDGGDYGDRIVVSHGGEHPQDLSSGGGYNVVYTSIDPVGDHQHVIAGQTPAITIDNADPGISTTVSNSGVSGTDKNLPPFIVGNWIMRLA